MQSSRNALQRGRWEPTQAAHAGLVLARCLALQKATDRETDDAAEARRELHSQAIQAARRARQVYELAFRRWQGSLPPGTCQGTFRVAGRLIVGLGGENVLEAGVTLHHTYGVPYIPGAALKGLAAHYCHRVVGPVDPDYRIGGEVHRALFGTTLRSGGDQSTDDTAEGAGHITFHDAWLRPECLGPDNQGLVTDVMTPHHGDYYDGKQPAPTDFDDPNPVTFLSVAGAFQVAISCDVPGPEGDAWAELALRVLENALAQWGVGGKTSSGYGRMRTTDGEGRPASDSPAVQAARKPTHKAGDVVTVTRIDDPKGKRRAWFQAEDGFGGVVTQGTAPDIEIGKTTTLEIAAPLQNGYNFRVPTTPKPNGGRR